MKHRSIAPSRWTRLALLGAAVAAASAGRLAAYPAQGAGAFAQQSAVAVRATLDSAGITRDHTAGGDTSAARITSTSSDSTAAHAHGSGSVDLVTAATRDYQRTGVARTVEEGAFVTFPYGHVQPTVTCAPLRACVIELQAGEVVLSKIAGDTQRWEIQLAPAGSDGRTPLVVVKPHDCGLTTNLVLATTAGRIYDMTLDSPPCPRAAGNPLGAYIRHVRFYYPDAMVQAWSTTTAVAAAPPTGVTAVSSAQGPSAARVDAFNFEYRLHRDHGFPWSPLAVFDDGAHCYIKLPPLAAHRDEPVLFLLRDDGTKALMNYSVSGDTYVSDRVFRAAVLVIGEASQERTLRIENLRYEAPPSLEPEVKGDAAGAPQPNGGPHE